MTEPLDSPPATPEGDDTINTPEDLPEIAEDEVEDAPELEDEEDEDDS